MSGKWQTRVAQPLRALFTQGLGPEKITQCLIFGAAISLFPVLGTTSLLCAAAAWRFRLNLPAIQAVNWLLAGAQLALLLPFLRLGEMVFQAPPLPFTAAEIADLARAGLGAFILRFWRALLLAVAGWALTVIPLAALVYFPLKRALGRKSTQKGGWLNARDGAINRGMSEKEL